MFAADRPRVLSVASGVSLVLVVLGVVVIALARARDVLLANHDVGWFLHAGEVWVDGGKIGVDVVDTNPPLVIWVAGLEVAVARGLGASPFVVHALATCAVSVLGVWLATRAFRRAGLAREALAVWAPLTLAAAIAVTGYDFGQREHWLAFLLLPYAGWALVPRQFSGERALAGVLAGLAVALKPHYVIVVVLSELFGLWRAKSARQLLRVEPLCVAACGPIYLMAIAWSAPSYSIDLADTLAVYAAYGREVPLWSAHTLLVLCAVVLAAPVGWLHPRTVAPALLASLSAGSAAAAWIQRKNFEYHHVPTDLFAGAALALAFALVAVRAARRPWITPALLGVVTVGCLAWLHSLPRVPRELALRTALGGAIERLTPDQSVFVFATAVGATFPSVNFGTARSLSPYSCLWPIAGNYTPRERHAYPFSYRRLDEMTRVERRLVERVVGVLVRERPALLVFDRRPLKQGFGRTDLDLRRYFEADPDFVVFMGSYRRLAPDRFFEYYERRGE